MHAEHRLERKEPHVSTRNDRIPDDPQSHPVETVEALEREQSIPDAEAVPAEDVTENPDTDELEGLPGPSQDETSEPAG